MSREQKELNEFLKNIKPEDNWLNSYKYYVPKFIVEAETKINWNDWNENIFEEFFLKARGQCVSSLPQEYFTETEQDAIKTNWHELSPSLKKLAENQDEPQWDIYNKITRFIKNYTQKNRPAATNRIIASLQPHLLCTIVTDKKLNNFFNKLKKYTSNAIPEYENNNWFKNSYNILKLIQEEMNTTNKMDIVTYPWQLLEKFNELEVEDKKIQIQMEKIKNLLKANKNLILTGAPGTGKTYLAKEIAKTMEAESEFVQFHPSYDYTDFVEGLRPTKPAENGNIGFELTDGVFKKFCKKALKEDSKKFVFVIDEINRGEISKIFGELFFSIDPGYRGTKGKVQTQYANMIKNDDDFKDGFYVPENVYIIGTMNDIDRSVESFDFAMRRRFTWVEIKANENLNMLSQLNELEEEAKRKLLALNNAIWDESKNEGIEGLSAAFHIGASYFLNLAKYKDAQFEQLWKYHLEPLLREYLRGSQDVKNKLESLETAYNSVNEPTANNGQ
jgi:5-methylcytosine-specific restriction protein B